MKDRPSIANCCMCNNILQYFYCKPKTFRVLTYFVVGPLEIGLEIVYLLHSSFNNSIQLSIYGKTVRSNSGTHA
jgi:hypothetical protein